ncbi:hypothetical protein P154DRAFT_517586 [Amniculicola lignicola CBS 123094]|uniref:ZZ-type domain-containing protein n=1 Tax=Amniculicola lignicola CBS 123094 TaxID=1392246 RepID=A0A6A5X070_9PLEO|nr:hypothetical protein P154DRAFT_517586 [Amniculicola lignicola CBS 123094]
MATPNPNQRYSFVGQVLAQGQINRASQNNPQSPSNQGQRYALPPSGYVQAHYAPTVPMIAELPAPLPIAPPTTTSAKQLDEDEKLAQQLHQMELAEARRASIMLQSPVIGSAPTFPQCPPGQHTPPQQPGRPYSQSLSTNPGQRLMHQMWGRPLSHRPSQSLSSEVVPTPMSVSPTALLPPAPNDPVLLAQYLEYHRQVPYPPQWVLPPVIVTFYHTFYWLPKGDWLSPIHSDTWHTVRFQHQKANTSKPPFKLTYKTKGGVLRDLRYEWAMTSPAAGKKAGEKPTWTYSLRRDRDSHQKVIETLISPKGKEVLCTYLHAANYDSLQFIGPDGKSYKWVSQIPLNSMHGARFDTIRHALFVSTERFGNQDPLYGQIVADHTYWDGYINTGEVHPVTVKCDGCDAQPIVGLRWRCKTCRNHDVCESCRVSILSVKPTCRFTLVSIPDEALYIRYPNIDTSMVIATLTILKDWQKHMIGKQKMRDPGGFATTLNSARKSDLGRVSHWKVSDYTKGSGDEVYGTLIKAVENANQAAEAAVMIGDVVGAMGG